MAKVGTLETLKESGVLDNLTNQNKQQPVQSKEPSQSISFKDLPPEGQTQLAAKAGIQLDPQTLAAHHVTTKVLDSALKKGVQSGNINNPGPQGLA